MTNPCPLCRAEYPSGETCQERFDCCLALEFENPGTYGAVHHLTVTCYMLQHNRYSREGWLQSRALLAEFVEQGHIRIRYAGSIARHLIISSAPGASPRGDRLAEFDRIIWTRTIADLHTEEPVQYCKDVRAWAESILADTEFLYKSVSLRMGD